jgi:prepilin-type N-terminal cleavage/methylation domain-containing protein
MRTMHLNRGQDGFTLVELAIVMIIIGLLIGGILKGQELISNAQITATVSQIKGIDAAMSTFRDQYDTLPGDIRNPDTRLPNCNGVDPCQNGGNANGRIDGNVTAVPTAEMEATFAHLSAADLVTGIDPTMDSADTSWGGYYPAAEIAGGYHIAFDATGALGSNASSRAGHYLVLNLTPGAQPDGTALTAFQAARIDRKLDDGTPNTGSVFDDTNCIANNVYAEDDDSAQCDLFIRIQG